VNRKLCKLIACGELTMAREQISAGWQIDRSRFNDFEVCQIEQLNVPVANKQQLIFALEILVIGNAVVYNVDTEGAFIFDDLLKLAEGR
jgi:hypothetical protein